EGAAKETGNKKGAQGYCTESVKNVELLHFLDRLDAEITQYDPEKKFVTNVSTFSDLIKELHSGFIGSPSAEPKLPSGGREQISQLLLPLESDSPETIRRFVNHKGNSTHILIDTKDEGSIEWFKLEGRIKDLLVELKSDFPGVNEKFDVKFSGTLVMTENALSHIIKDLVSSILFAFVIIAVLMIILFRSFKIGVVSMIPNVLPLFMTFGFMGYTGITLRTATAVIFAISLGIAVNDTIHLLARFSSEVREGKDLTTALKDSVRTTGMAMMISTFVLIIGFSINLFSDFVAVYHFGILISITIFWALLADLFLTPALIHVFRLDREIKTMKRG
ncbi:MAG: MMPL family transporter, partial [Deltaproteobacteria bacterium]|nr:MMPL family transporter [Deltaproteobacteria bacterium]